MPDIALSPVADLDALGPRWRALEARAEPSFFQSWTWVGCLAAERFPDPWLLELRAGGETVGLALLNRAGPWWDRGRLHLTESGDPARDSPFVEYNGILLARGAGALLAPGLAALLHGRTLRLSGTDDAHLEAARAVGRVRVLATRAAPFVDLSGDFLAGLSGNARYQLRRSDRRYGALAVRRAADVAEALAFLDRLTALHQATWTARGRPGAFARPFFRRFHRDLVARGLPRGEVDLLRIAAGDRVVGYLYNFQLRGQVFSYQSGFDYAGASGHEKPGLTCHHQAIRLYQAETASRYDFLAGDDRYKRSLAGGEAAMHWLDVAPSGSWRGLISHFR